MFAIIWASITGPALSRAAIMPGESREEEPDSCSQNMYLVQENDNIMVTT